jgi:choloylglycine hydrolase
MKRASILPLLTVLILLLMSQPGDPCSSFYVGDRDQGVFGKNFDWQVDDGLVIVNKRHVSKTASTASLYDQPAASWTSKYGNITFNQLGREAPFGGINEVGLVVEMMLHRGTEYPAPDSRKSISSLQWIQYQLDNFSSVGEVIASDSDIRIYPAKSRYPIHYLVCDNNGNCASIEFIGGNLVTHTGESMLVKTLTNSTYSQSIDFLKRHVGFGGELSIPNTTTSLGRFVRAANMVKNYDPKIYKSTVDSAFDILKNVKRSDTKWNIVYDIQNRRIHFRTSTNGRIRYIDLSSVDFSCGTPVKVLDINADIEGDVKGKFLDYTGEINRRLLESVKLFYGISEGFMDIMLRYPESTVCSR